MLSVIGFHAFPELFKGGFTGVDIFFVISGFLISTILFGSLEHGTFSFAEFYARRIRRIFPALLAVMLACLGLGAFVLLADEYRQLGKHVAGGAGFVANLVLWGEDNYFDNASETKPLQHLWSLGIEEQFYIVWPLLLWLSWKGRISLLAVTLAVTAMSFFLNLLAYQGDPVADFYSPLTRFWELSVGSVLGYMSLRQTEVAPAVRSGLSVLGAVLLAAGFVLITRDYFYPGVWALLPVLGAAMMIAAGEHAWLNRMVLANRSLVLIGLISYPLYLWHWPLLSFLRIVQGEAPPAAHRAGAVLITFMLAWMTYRWMELPVRTGNIRKKAIALAAGMAATGAVGAAIYFSDGVPSRKLSLSVLEGDIGHVEFHKYPLERFHRCTPERIAAEALKYDGYVRCLQSRNDREVDMAIVGDSHAEHLFIGLAELLPDRNIAFYIKGSAPFAGNEEFAHIYEHVLASKSIRKVILTMYWTERMAQVPPGSSPEREILAAAERLMKSGKQVFLTDDIPAFPFSPHRCAVRRPLAAVQPCTVDKVRAVEAYNSYASVLRAVIAEDPRIRMLETWRHFCNDRECSMVRQGSVLYRDSNHLNILGSQYLALEIIAENPELR